MYASISLTSAEKNYAIIDKELLAVLFSCERFHQYVYGNKTFTESEHKPQGSKQRNHQQELQRGCKGCCYICRSMISSYHTNLVLADVLSRASLKDTDPEISDEELAAQIHMVCSNNQVIGTNLEEIRRSKGDD